MIHVILAFGLLAASLPAISARESISNCPTVTPAQNLRSAALEGRWYIQSRERSQQISDRKCLSILFTTSENRVLYYTIYWMKIMSRRYDHQTALIEIPDRSDESKWKVTQTRYPNDPPIDYWVLDTDYDNYFTLFLCDSGKPQITIFTRQRKPSNAILLAAMESTYKHGFTSSSFGWYNQDGCYN